MKKINSFFMFLLTVTLLSLFLFTPQNAFGATAKLLSSPYLYNFNNLKSSLQEVGSEILSTSPYWWVNSGGYMLFDGSRGSTYQGSLPTTDPWRILYSLNNPTDTDRGYHPQNIFRLLTRSKWQNARQEAYFVIKNDNLSMSSNRNQSNGILLFNRYQDSDNLYYAGVRVDGSVIIKKKKGGTYYTLAEVKKVFPGNYDRESAPNLLPKNKWVGLRVETLNQSGGKLEIRVYTDLGWAGKWKLAAIALDDGIKYGGTAFTGSGYGGIRTDFMDVEFENFRFLNIDQFTSS